MYNFKVADSTVAWVSKKVMLESEIPAPRTPLESLKIDPKFLGGMKPGHEDRFPNELTTKAILGWRAAIGIKAYIDDKVVLATSPDKVQDFSFSEVRDLMNGEDILTLGGKNEMFILNREELKPRRGVRYWGFLDTFRYRDAEEGKTYMVITENFDDMVGVPENLTGYNDFLRKIHYRQNMLLNERCDEIANPVKYAVKDIRTTFGFSPEGLAEQAELDDKVIERAEKSGDVTINQLMKIASATNRELKVNFE